MAEIWQHIVSSGWENAPCWPSFSYRSIYSGHSCSSAKSSTWTWWSQSRHISEGLAVQQEKHKTIFKSGRFPHIRSLWLPSHDHSKSHNSFLRPRSCESWRVDLNGSIDNICTWWKSAHSFQTLRARRQDISRMHPGGIILAIFI